MRLPKLLSFSILVAYVLVFSSLLVLLWAHLCMLPQFDWNAARLAPAYALNAGLPLYSPPSSASQLGWIYGPVMPEIYRVVGLLPSLTSGMVAAGLLNLVLCLLPTFVFLRGQGGGLRRSLFLTGVLSILYLSNLSTGLQTTTLHVDVPCIALGLLSCIFLGKYVEAQRPASLHLAVLCLVLAIWTKQIAVFLVPAMLLWLWLEKKRNCILPLLRIFLIYALLSLLLCLYVFGAENIIFFVYWFHQLNPAKTPGAIVQELSGVVRLSWPFLLLVLCVTPVLIHRRHELRAAPGHALSRLLACVGVLLIPVGLLAYTKQGGGPNSFHFVTYLLVALVLLFSSEEKAPLPTTKRLHLGVLVLLSLCLVAGFRLAGTLNMIWTPSQRQEELLAVVRANPGKIYAPWNPLVTVYAEQRILPFDDALLSLYRAGRPVPAQAMREIIPHGMQIYYQEPCVSHFALNYFPQLLKNP